MIGRGEAWNGFCLATLLVVVVVEANSTEVQFHKQALTTNYYCDGVSAGDIDRDGQVDVVAGPFWYKGPDFRRAYEFYPAKVFETAPSPSDSMFSYVYDFNRDGWQDILVLGRVHLHSAYWYENPGDKDINGAGHWKKHFVFERIRGESPPFTDVDGDGKPELVAHWENRWGFIRPDWDHPTNRWSFNPITAPGKYDQFYHGTGVGDINGDGRLDLLLNEGWWEQPARAGEEWVARPFRFGGKGGAQMFVYDVDGDGLNDVITALDAHGWGLAWFRQLQEGKQIRFERHTIMGDRNEEQKYGAAFSQPHALALADVDGDGLQDIITGKRRWAHGPTGDVEPNEEPVVYWFGLRRLATGAVFTPHRIDDWSGVGVQITAVDINADKRADILTASKLGVFAFLNAQASIPKEEKPRLLVLTDIGGDPDDQQSLIRLMLYANEFDIEGLIATASGVPGELKQSVIKPELIREIVDAYGIVQTNLSRHAKGFPSAAEMRAVIKSGNPQRGTNFIGEGHDTEGSRWIIERADKSDTRPLNISIWGGQTDFAQALWRVRKDRGKEGLTRFINAIRIYDIDDQDRIVEHIWGEFPGLFYILSKAPKGRDTRLGGYRGMYLDGDVSLTSREWVDRHIRVNHGPLGALYPTRTWTAPNPHGVLKEGDTPSWFYFLPNGLSDPAHPEWGNWGGRFTNWTERIYRDARLGNDSSARSNVWPWRPEYQAEFEARMDWCVAAQANHSPVAKLQGEASPSATRLQAKIDTEVSLTAEGSSDPDGDKVEASWFVYHEAGTASGSLSSTNGWRTTFKSSTPGWAHIILRVQDSGKPALTSYRRAVIEIRP